MLLIKESLQKKLLQFKNMTLFFYSILTEIPPPSFFLVFHKYNNYRTTKLQLALNKKVMYS